MQPGADGGWRDTQCGGDLSRLHAAVVAQDDGDAEVGGEMVDSVAQIQCTSVVAATRVCREQCQSLQTCDIRPVVGQGLGEPELPAKAAAPPLAAHVECDLQEPGAQRPLVAQSRSGLPGLLQRLLSGILCLDGPDERGSE